MPDTGEMFRVLSSQIVCQLSTQKVTILTYLKILFTGRCWEQLDKGWHSPTPAASPSSLDANFFPGDTEGDILQPWRMVIITIDTL